MKMVPGYRPNDETIPIMGGSLNTMVSTKDIVTYNPYRPIPRPYAKGGILCKPKVGKSTSPAGFVPFEKKAPGKPVVK